MSEGNDQNRTEAPTQRRLQQAKEAGQVAVSPEIGILASLAAGMTTVFFIAPFLLAQLTGDLALLLQHLETSPARAIRLLLPRIVLDTLPLVLIPALAAILAGAAQTGFSVSFTPMRPSLTRLNPIAGFKRLFAVRNLLESAKALCKLLAVALVLWQSVTASLNTIPALLWSDPHLILTPLHNIALRIVFSVLAVQMVVAVLDTVWARFSHIRSLRMTVQEMKDEIKETEGDPLIKSRLRRLRQQRAKHRIQ